MSSTLKEYKSKRKFNATPEPEGKTENGISKGKLRFVVQKHDATRLHYDFRLEIDGVLKSWAVPKGPSMNPSDKRLAMMVEDHPLEYEKFEGIIPPGNYGAGTVMVWDEGTYQSIESKEVSNEEALLKGLKSGNLKFVVSGKKLKGEFALVKIKGESSKGNEWLLLKKKDKFASDEDITLKDKSVLTKRSLEQIKLESGLGNTVWQSSRKKQRGDGKQISELSEKSKSKKRLNDNNSIVKNTVTSHSVQPMLATLTDNAFNSTDWLFEIKWDGYRAIAEIEKGNVLLYSRNLQPFNEAYPEVVEDLKTIGQDVVIDGELVVLDEKGNAHFQLIQNYKKTHSGKIVYYVFDILYLNGKDLRSLPLIKRKEILKETLPVGDKIRYNDHLLHNGIDFYNAALQQQLEGIIGKKTTSIYTEGERTKDWVKIKTQKRQEALIAGFTQPKGGRKNFGALVLGLYEENNFKYIGHTGSGFNDEAIKEINEILKPHIQHQCPFAEVPETNMPVTWTKPVVICEVKFQEWTNDGLMRIPIFIGLRNDKAPEEVSRENDVSHSSIIEENQVSKPVRKSGKKAPPTEKQFLIEAQRINIEDTEDGLVNIDNKQLKLSNLNKVYWPEAGYKKHDLLEYYDKVASFILPYLKDRPENLRRNPNGYKEKSFFQKNMPASIPTWIETIKIFSESNKEKLNYMICQDKASLLYMVNLGCIELNPWLSRKDSIDKPDYIVIDLDPQDVTFEAVIEVANAVKIILDKGKLIGFPKTSGSRGIHIYIPLGAKYSYDQARQFAELIASLTNQIVPEITSLERNPAKRRNRIYLDYLQNRLGQTLAAPYCVRPKEHATVSTPLLWEEVKNGLSPLQFDIKTIFTRLKKYGDLFKGIFEKDNDNDIGNAINFLSQK